MGTWGTGLFSDDVACDVRNLYRELLEDGVDDVAAARLTVEKFSAYFEESDGVALLAFAVTQSKLGRLDPDIRQRALAVLDRGADLDLWARDNPKLLPKRRAALEQARAQLTGQQPVRKRLRPPKRISSGLAGGDVLALALPRRLVLLRVVRVLVHRLGETPVLEALDFEGTEVPPRDALERLGPNLKERVGLAPDLADQGRFFAFVMQGIDWEGAGFRKVERISPRTGDDKAPLPSSGVAWAQIAKRYRDRSQ